MKLEDLIIQIKNKNSFLCVGLDTDIDKIPKFLLNEDDPIFSFNKSIIDHTNKYCVAYKINTAFYESHGVKGWESMKKTIDYINDNHPEIFTIADAKRGDIGNTSKMYAQSFFTEMNFDSLTINPYMGSDSVKPFLEFKNKIFRSWCNGCWRYLVSYSACQAINRKYSIKFKDAKRKF